MSKQLDRLEQIARSVANSDHGLALLALGSAGVQRHRIDEYSDLDFFLICEQGYKNIYLSNLGWLKKIAPVAFSFKNTVDGYKLLYEDGVFCEFAVFEPNELCHISFSQGKIVWAKQGFDASLCNPTINKLSLEIKDHEYHLGEALTNLYVGVGRYHRGEKLSAFQFIQNHAFWHLLELVALDEPTAENTDGDLFNISRRFELRYPEFADIMANFLLGYDHSLLAAERILAWLDKHHGINQTMKNKIFDLIHQHDHQ